jgi:hypothetical protein
VASGQVKATTPYSLSDGENMKSLLIGAGHSRQKKIWLGEQSEWLGQLVTLDMGDNCGADVVWDLNVRPLPFADGEFVELAAYDVLEHVGRQGDWKGWFDEMAEYHRILVAGGTFGVIVPVNEDAFADPGHTRFFQQNYFGFLTREFYDNNLANGAQVTDYRWYLKAYWEIMHLEHKNNHIAVMLRKA